MECNERAAEETVGRRLNGAQGAFDPRQSADRSQPTSELSPIICLKTVQHSSFLAKAKCIRASLILR